MLDLADLAERVQSRITIRAERPITFDVFVDLPNNEYLELVDGELVTTRMMTAQLEQEVLAGWLYHVLDLYVKRRRLGRVLGSRTLLETGVNTGHAPDLVFVSNDNLFILRERAIIGAPDLIIELVSSSDNASRLARLRREYYFLRAPEVVFIDEQKRQVSVLLFRESDAGYTETILTEGEWVSQSVSGFHIPVRWLLSTSRPDEIDTVLNLLSESNA